MRREQLRAFRRFCKYHGVPWRNIWRIERALLEDLEDRGALEDPSRVVLIKGRRIE